ncbi:MAG: KpsF/GutQ family sugar-phosphate isomerase [Paracoccaceae bacterium]|nr:KpsF/GutQ family sugar-phosphate isomerase [Paracoccaceae bacterium]
MSTIATSLIETARNVLKIEAQALLKLADNMPEDFPRLITTIINCKGRVVVAGVGKSGHIGRKIYATLASTGTPSYFVHATEASHGDMGMIVEGDICILISNSGETSEMRDIVAHTRRFSIPMAAISSNTDSTLMHAADFALGLPDAAEACAIGMAPTTSTTMTLALGDALAVTLMHERNFNAESFQVFHPGGKLGAQMTRIRDLMHGGDNIPKVTPEMPVQDALIEMTSKGFGIAVLINSEKIIGIISDGDLRRHMHHLMEKTAGDIASPDPVTVSEDTFAADALRIMHANKISVLVVADQENHALGILHIQDLLRAGVA